MVKLYDLDDDGIKKVILKNVKTEDMVEVEEDAAKRMLGTEEYIEANGNEVLNYFFDRDKKTEGENTYKDALFRVVSLIEDMETCDKNQRPQQKKIIWNSIPIDHITIRKGEDKTDFIFSLNNGTTLNLESSDVLTPNKFRERFAQSTRILLPNIYTDHWVGIFNKWLMEYDVIEEKEEISERQEIIDEVLLYLTGAQLIISKPGERENIVCLHDNTLWITSSQMKKIISRISRIVTLRQARSWLQKYMIGGTKNVRVGNGWVRVWGFSPRRVGADTSNAVELGDEDET